MEKRKVSKVHWAWIILGSSFVNLFINYGIQIGAYPILLPKMIEEIGINMNQAGMIRAAYFFTYVLLSPLMGWLTDRIGGRKVISFFCLFLGGGTFLMGRVSSLFTAILFHGIVGIGAAAMWIPIVTMLQHWFGVRRRGLALGILSPSYAVGLFVMAVALPPIVKAYSWRVAWSLLGATGLMLTVMNTLLLRSDPGETGTPPWGETSKTVEPSPPTAPAFNFRTIFRSPHFWLIGASYLFVSIGVYIVSDFIVTYGVRELTIPYPVSASLIGIMALTGIPGCLILTPLSDHIGRKKLLIVAHSMMAMSMLWIILVKGNLTLLRVGIGWFGFFYGAIWPIYAAFARDHSPKEVAGTVIGILTIFFGVGAMAGPILAGYLADVTGTFRWSFGLGALASLLAALLIAFLKTPMEFQRE